MDPGIPHIINERRETRESKLERCLVRLLGTCELNLDEIEDDTREAIGEALAALDPEA